MSLECQNSNIIHLPNIDSYQNPTLDITSIPRFPLNNDLQPLAVLEYKGIHEIFIIKGQYVKYARRWLGCWGWCACCCSSKKKQKTIHSKLGYMVRIPVSIQSRTGASRTGASRTGASRTGASREADYKFSYKNWIIIKKPELICKLEEWLYLGFYVSLEEYINDDVIIQKAKKIIIEMLDLLPS